MLCKQCSKEIENNARFCAYCMAEQKEYSEVTFSMSDTEDEANLGFSKADSEYEPPKILSATLKVNTPCVNDTKGGEDRAYQSTAKHMEDKKLHKDNKEVDRIKPNTSGLSIRKEKKRVKQRQMSLQKALQDRLEEEKQEALSQSMYQGLNQDVVEEEDKHTGQKDRSIRRSILGIVFGILLTVCIMFYIGSMSKKTDYMIQTKNAIEVYTSESEMKTYVFNAKGDMLFKTVGAYQSYYTSDHSAAILFNWNERIGIYVNDNHVKLFDSTIESFALSEDGNFVLYSIPGGLGKYYLKLYDIAKDTEVMIDNQAKRFELLNVLPGGRSISYLTYTVSAEGDPQEIQSYLVRNNGKPELVGENICIFAVSYDMNYIYYYTLRDNGNITLYVRNDEKDSLLSENISNPIYFNRDFSQVLFADGDSYYMSERGLEKQKILDHMVTGLLMPSKGITSSKSALFRYYGIDNFADKLLVCNDNTIQILDEKQRVKEIAITRDNESAMLSADGDSLLYLDPKDNLILLRDIDGEAKQSVLAEKVSEYKASDDLSKIYIRKDNNLYYIEHETMEKIISKDILDLSRDYEGDTVFFLKDYHNGKGTLYYSRSGGLPDAVEGGVGVNGVREWNFGVIYQKLVNGSTAVFYNTEGIDFLFIMDGMNLLGTNFY